MTRLDIRVQYAVIDIIDRIRCVFRGHEYELMDNGLFGAWYSAGYFCVTCGKENTKEYDPTPCCQIAISGNSACDC